MCQKSKCESQVYVKDLREVMTYQGKRLEYPKNYNEIVKNGTIMVSTNSAGNTDLKLLYGEKDKNGLRPSWILVQIAADECHSKAYYTMYGLLSPVEELHKSYYEPFGFSSLKLRKYLPVIDIKETGEPDNPFQIVNSLYIAKKGCSLNIESGEVDAHNRKEKGLNGKQLYNSTYGKLDPKFFVIRDENKKVEYDKTIFLFPIIFLSYTVIFTLKILTFLPMKFGECLLSKQNLFAKVLGNIFFTPFVPVKFMVDLLAILIKIPVLLFVANEKKYGDSYCTRWKYELIQCFHELKSDCSVIKHGKRQITESDYGEWTLIGTWDELNIRKNHIQESFEVPLIETES